MGDVFRLLSIHIIQHKPPRLQKLLRNQKVNQGKKKNQERMEKDKDSYMRRKSLIFLNGFMDVFRLLSIHIIQHKPPRLEKLPKLRKLLRHQKVNQEKKKNQERMEK